MFETFTHSKNQNKQDNYWDYSRFNNYGFQRMYNILDNILCFDFLKTIIVQTPANQCNRSEYMYVDLTFFTFFITPLAPSLSLF